VLYRALSALAIGVSSTSDPVHVRGNGSAVPTAKSGQVVNAQRTQRVSGAAPRAALSVEGREGGPRRVLDGKLLSVLLVKNCVYACSENVSFETGRRVGGRRACQLLFGRTWLNRRVVVCLAHRITEEVVGGMCWVFGKGADVCSEGLSFRIVSVLRHLTCSKLPLVTLETYTQCRRRVRLILETLTKPLILTSHRKPFNAVAYINKTGM